MTRVAFRFCFLYFGLFCLWFAQITYAFAGILALWLPAGAVMWQMLLTAPGHTVSMALREVDLSSFTLRNRGFHWVQEYPYFR
ncbi:hypothetical protein C6A86_024535 [Mycobacterium sp. ITM-2016-00316]|uniref:hypothetical protein n=1 Tax=Mycobacterium sp. ITM-2016-00316 TaxID=2099695 RepID=UPI00287FE16A|nr:hypothetical protein [Mycobacterium sp. ITM-2016-00316]WNG81311.1 hypothetical protein C6A86_024535 [Mycobacterium sp. ITM-2016-00316]